MDQSSDTLGWNFRAKSYLLFPVTFAPVLLPSAPLSPSLCGCGKPSQDPDEGGSNPVVANTQ